VAGSPLPCLLLLLCRLLCLCRLLRRRRRLLQLLRRSCLNVRPLQRAIAGRAPGVYIVNPLHKCDCLDSGCSVGGMCHRDSPGVHSRRVLPEAERFTINGVAGCEEIAEMGLVDYRVPAEVWHADLAIQEFMARIQAAFAAEDQLYLYWRVEMFLTKSMRPGLTLFSLGRVVVEDGWTVTLDGAPGASHPCATLSLPPLQLPVLDYQRLGFHGNPILSDQSLFG